MEIKEDVEGGKQKGMREPLIGEQNNQLVHACTDHHHHPWMLYFTTLVAVCGSYEFGACVSLYFSLNQQLFYTISRVLYNFCYFYFSRLNFHLQLKMLSGRILIFLWQR